MRTQASAIADMRQRLLSTDKVGKLYKVKDVVGLGSQATVSVAVHRKTGGQVAVKIYDKRREDFIENEMLRECDLLDRCRHPHVVEFISLHESKKSFEVVMEFCPAGEWLDTMILRQSDRGGSAPYTEDESKPLVRQLLYAIKFLHQQKVCHRDIKPENVLVIHGSTESHSITLKLSDFGIAADLSLLMAPLTEPYGSPEYAAPEVTATVGTRPAGYGMEVDIWSLGVVVFFMLTGHLPFDGPDASTVRRKVSNVSTQACFATSGACDIVGPEGIGILSSMLSKTPTERPSATQLLNSGWLQTGSESHSVEITTGEPNDFGAAHAAGTTVADIQKAEALPELQPEPELEPEPQQEEHRKTEECLAVDIPTHQPSSTEEGTPPGQGDLPQNPQVETAERRHRHEEALVEVYASSLDNDTFEFLRSLSAEQHAALLDRATTRRVVAASAAAETPKLILGGDDDGAKEQALKVASLPPGS